MEPRLTSSVFVSSLVRRVNAEGGSAMILKKGDADAGAIMLLLCERGRNLRVFERQLDFEHGYIWRKTAVENEQDIEFIDKFINSRQRVDPDLWVVELDIAQPERFIAQSADFD